MAEAKKEYERELYYTPTEDDLIPGLEFELYDDYSEGDENAKWHPLVYGQNFTDKQGSITYIHPLLENRIRVKILNLEDFKKLGFEPTEDKDIVRLKTSYQDDKGEVYLYCLFKTAQDKTIVVDLYYEFLYKERLNQDRVYVGKCMNYAELRRILKNTTSLIK